MIPQKRYCLIFLVFISNLLFAGAPVKVQQFINHKDWNFVENKGQIATPNPAKGENGYDLHPEIKYYGHQGGVYLYCKPGMLSFVFTKVEKEPEQISEATGKIIADPLNSKFNTQHSTFSSERADLVLIGSNQNAQIIASDQQEYYENFYLAHTPEEGITNVHTFKTVTYKNIYPNIDMVIHAKEQGMKYEFVVYPGGKVGDIKMLWNGLEQIGIAENGSIKYSLSSGKISESKPYTYQDRKEIASCFSKKGNLVIFKTKDYNKTKTLVIDPSLIWATYFGGSDYEYGQNVGVDPYANVIMAGRTGSYSGIATSGAYQTYSYFSNNAFLAKFSSSGKLVWATYYGGNGEDGAFGIAIDTSGNPYISGYTYSSNGIATSGAYQTYLRGSWGPKNAFLAKFSSSGSRIWATYFGIGDVDCNGIAMDNRSGNIFISGRNNDSVLATSGAYQTSPGYGYLAKFNNSGKLLWCTYFGSCCAVIGGLRVATDPSGNVFLGGFTTPYGIIATSGAYQTSYGGGGANAIDAFLAKFTPGGSLLWCTYYGGPGSENSNGFWLAADDFGNAIISGSTNSSTGIATSGAYQTSLGGSDDCYLAKFGPGGALLWSTYFGGSDVDGAASIAINGSDDIFITGKTASSSGIATSGAYQTSNAGGTQDAFIAKFSYSGRLWYASYVGKSSTEGGLGVALDGSNGVYISGFINSGGFATSGAYQTSIAGNYDAFLAKFALPPSYYNETGITSILSPADTFCTGSKNIKVRLKNFGAKMLDSVTINWSVNKKIQTPYQWTGKLKTDSFVSVTLGTYSFSTGNSAIMAWTSKPNGAMDSVPVNDTTFLVVNSVAYPQPKAGKNDTICSGDSLTLGGVLVGGLSYAWTSSPSGFTSTESNPVVKPGVNTTFYVLETTLKAGCSKSDSVAIKVNPLPVPFAGSTQTVCSGQGVKIGGISASGNGYSWKSRPLGFSSTISNPTVSPVSNTTFILTQSISTTGCSKTDSVIINVKTAPLPAVTGSLSVCEGASLPYQTKGKNGDIYKWSIANGIITSADTSRIITVRWTNAGPGMIKVVESNPNGCKDSSILKITVNSLPAAFAGTSQSLCSGNSILIGSTLDSGNNYSWTSKPAGFSSSASNPKISPSVSTTYFLTKTIAATGCSKSDSIKVTVNPLPISKVGPAQTTCSGDKTGIGSSLLSGYSYSWTSNPSGFTSSLPDPVVRPNVSTIFTLTATIIATGCSKTDSVKITVNPLPAPNAGGNHSICLGNSITIGSNTIAGHVYSWTSRPIGFSSSANDITVSPFTTTTYYLTETITATGCAKTDSAFITVYQLPNPKWFINYSGKTTWLNALDSSLSNASYQWDFGDGVTDSVSGHLAKHLYQKNSNYLVKLRLTNTNGCANELDSTVLITVSGIENKQSDPVAFNIFPNPFTTTTTIQYHLSNPSQIKIELSDITGKQIGLITNEKQPAGDYSTEINAEKYHLQPGVYLVKFMVDGEMISKQLIKF
jgi:hypothetical protein